MRLTFEVQQMADGVRQYLFYGYALNALVTPRGRNILGMFASHLLRVMFKKVEYNRLPKRLIIKFSKLSSGRGINKDLR